MWQAPILRRFGFARRSPPVDGEVIEIERCRAICRCWTINLEVSDENSGGPAESEIRIYSLVNDGFNAVKPYRVIRDIAIVIAGVTDLYVVPCILCPVGRVA